VVEKKMKEIFLLLMFALALYGILKEPLLKFRKFSFRIDYGTAPLISVLILSVFGYVDGQILADSLAGINGVVPWQVILIFFAGAYICISIDSTGVLEYASFRIIRLSGGDPVRLYFGIVGLTAVLTIFTSNDIVILTMTPIICYMAKHSKISPVPYLLAVFFSANSWSMLFYVGNPPNIIVAQIFGFEFTEYAKYMLIPTLTAGLGTTFIVYFIFRKNMRGKVDLESGIRSDNYLRSRWTAAVSVIVFAAFFVTLSVAEHAGYQVWEVVLAYFLIYLILTFVFALYYLRTHFSSEKYHYEKTIESLLARNMKFTVTEFKMCFERVPWKTLPLIVSLFILIHLFSVNGITDRLAHFLNNFDGILSGSVMISLISAVGANVMINQPMTILFASAFQSPEYAVTGHAAVANGLALVAGTNLGGNLTLYGALAGLMWKKILAYNGIEMSYKEFLVHSLKVTPAVIVLTSIAIYLQMKYIF
jgi:arsenical pump membrane protein